MATERKSPDTLIVQTNLSGSISDIQDDPDSPDGNWLTHITNNVDTVCRVSFPTPTGNPTEGVDLQEFKMWVKQQPDGAGADPTVRIELYEDGSLLATILADTSVSSTTGVLHSGTWNANLLGTANGSLVECRIYGTAVGGAPGNRCTIEVGAVEWNVTYSAGDFEYTGSGSFDFSGNADYTLGFSYTASGSFDFSGEAICSPLFSDGFESGDLSAWDAAVTDEGKLSAHADAKLHGNYGLKCFIDDQTSKYVQDDTPDDETRYRVRFYFDPNSLTMADNDIFIIGYVVNNAFNDTFQVIIIKTAGVYKTYIVDATDGAWSKMTAYYTLTDEPHCIEIDWTAATGVGENDGEIKLWIDGELKETLADIDNDTESVGIFMLGVFGLDAGTDGTLYFDDFASNNDGSEIGEIADFEYIASGSLTFSGSATQEHSRNYLTTASGSFTFSGVGLYTLGFSYTCSGSFNFSGSATTIHSKDYLFVGSGTLTFSGSAIVVMGLTYEGQTGKWSGIEMCYENVYETTETFALHCDQLIANGFSQIRLHFADWNKPYDVDDTKVFVLAAIAKGLDVVFGISSANTVLTSSNWSGYVTAIEGYAAWAQANGVYEFVIGNHLEFYNDDDTLTDAQLRTNLRSLATSVQSIFTNGDVGYSISPTHLAAWISVGRGDIDQLSLMVYRNEEESTDWQDDIDDVVAAFGVDHTYVCEFNVDSGGYVWWYSQDEEVLAADITIMINYIKASGITRAFFFLYTIPSWYEENSFEVLKEDDTYKLLWWSLLDSAGASFRYSGEATCVLGFSFTASGSFDFSGTAVQEHSRYYLYTASGSFDFSGEATCVLGFSYTASGSFDFSGTAAQEHFKNYLTTGAGTFNFSGEGEYVAEKDFVYSATGSFVYSGTAIQFYTWNYSCVASGSFAYSGIASYSFGVSYVGDGDFVFSGSAECEYTIIAHFEHVGSGNFVYSGTAIQVYTCNYLYSGSGGLVFSGTAIYPVAVFTYVGSGILIYSGEAEFTYFTHWTKVDKETGDWNKVDKTDMGWLVEGWLIYGWLLVLWEKVSKVIGNWEKVNKE